MVIDAIWQWQLLTGATWSNLPSPSGMMESMVVPTLKAFSLRAHDNRELILAAGDQEAIMMSPGGSLLTSVELPAAPTHALICEDFSNDGLTDLILVTSNGVYGFVQTRQPGALFFSTLVGCLIVVMGVIFVTQYLNSMKGKPRASSVTALAGINIVALDKVYVLISVSISSNKGRIHSRAPAGAQGRLPICDSTPGLCKQAVDTVAGPPSYSIHNAYSPCHVLFYICLSFTDVTNRVWIVHWFPNLKISAALAYQASPGRYSLSQLLDFAGEVSKTGNLLESGGFGAVYKGLFADGPAVAVKVLSGSSDRRIEEQFMAEVSTIGRVHHFNLVQLYGFCFERDLRALV
ncbi:putative LRR receptor-like serine/threonine-protein kinase RFK1 [Vitis vinifera]|uniref:Putative LRR receptor-like serine/threonine-protein kinase RFK1 n=1 Tax=Vitis vinifera TaxID=29760 RepID=A0A438EV14_VITVI|nr:putative LRR receptor-like serine/threonine-protein kinase RFK1 [Vitis vinifera]